jgi:CRP/FNR family cyclic AMP-dependent transcriptional regulator
MDRTELLATVPLFEGLPERDLATLSGRLEEKRFAVGARVFAQGEAGTSMYIVVSGTVQVFLPSERDGGPRVVLADLRAGQYFGELALFDDKPRSASVEALVDTVVLQLTREDFAAYLANSKGAAMAVLGVMAERLRDTNALISNSAATNVVKEIEDHLTWPQRLADRVATLNGSWAFIIGLGLLTAAWSAVNAIPAATFDAYPYIFYNLALAILCALQGPLIVMSQNRRSTKDRAKAEADFRVNLKNEIGLERFERELLAFRSEASQRLQALERQRTRRSGAPIS